MGRELSAVEEQLAAISESVAQTVRERDLSLADIARSLPQESVLIDFVQYRRYESAVTPDPWRERRYVAYLTFPLARDSTNVVVERGVLGEAAPINSAVEELLQPIATRSLAPKPLPPVFTPPG